MLVLVILTENRVLDVNTHDRYQPITEREREHDDNIEKNRCVRLSI